MILHVITVTTHPHTPCATASTVAAATRAATTATMPSATRNDKTDNGARKDNMRQPHPTKEQANTQEDSKQCT